MRWFAIGFVSAFIPCLAVGLFLVTQYIDGEEN